MVWTEKAYAKINLFLEITGRRPDGYHTLTTVMQSVTLADTLSAEKTADGKGKITLSVQGADLGPCTDNLVFRAADLFLKRTGTADSWSFELTKDIPVSAGLAGGSADAGAVLRLLSRAYPGALSPEECLQLGAQLGADVPFCFLQGRALCLGVGDEVHPLPVTVRRIRFPPLRLMRRSTGCTTGFLRRFLTPGIPENCSGLLKRTILRNSYLDCSTALRK